jgi:hypothetical protein
MAISTAKAVTPTAVMTIARELIVHDGLLGAEDGVGSATRFGGGCADSLDVGSGDAIGGGLDSFAAATRGRLFTLFSPADRRLSEIRWSRALADNR